MQSFILQNLLPNLNEARYVLFIFLHVVKPLFRGTHTHTHTQNHLQYFHKKCEIDKTRYWGKKKCNFCVIT